MANGGISVSTRRINPGWAKKIAANLKSLAKKEVAVGFPRGGKAASLTYDNGASVLDVAVWNQFGTKDIPARPFMDQGTEAMIADVKGEMAAVARMANRKEVDAGQALKKMGDFGVKSIQLAITDGTYEPNAPSTKRRKKSDKPLIDTGKMRQSVASVVRERTN
jgi:hypothetical protein